MNTIRVKITIRGGEVWYATSPQVKDTPAKTVAYLNKQAVRKGVPATYELATEEAYWEYRASKGAFAGVPNAK
jgi:hypothetical protein